MWHTYLKKPTLDLKKKYIVLLSAINTIEMQLLILRRTKEKVVFTAIFIFVEKTMPSA